MSAQTVGRTRAAVALACIVVLLLAYAMWAAGLALVAGEGSLPPRSRVPDLPAGTHVQQETKQCASGGCWREIVVRPATGQTPSHLADQLGLSNEVHQSWRLLDPHSVTVGSTTKGDQLVLCVQD